MPYTARVSAPLARHLLGHPHAGLRRRLSVLRLTPFPPGSRSLQAGDAWNTVAARFPSLQGFVYGTNHDALIYTYEPSTETPTVRLAIVDGWIVPP
jgi:hypothetical protein